MSEFDRDVRLIMSASNLTEAEVWGRIGRLRDLDLDEQQIGALLDLSAGDYISWKFGGQYVNLGPQREAFELLEEKLNLFQADLTRFFEDRIGGDEAHTAWQMSWHARESLGVFAAQVASGLLEIKERIKSGEQGRGRPSAARLVLEVFALRQWGANRVLSFSGGGGESFREACEIAIEFSGRGAADPDYALRRAREMWSQSGAAINKASQK